MLGKKAQALIEFVLLLPVIIILLFSSIDIFNLILKKNDFSNRLNDEVVLLEHNKETYAEFERKLEKEKIDITFEINDNYIKIKAKKVMNWISPITEAILKNYTISLERVIPLE